MLAVLAAAGPAATLAAMSSAASTDESNGATGLEHGLERFRAVRRELEGAVLPLATSLDGRRFEFQASLHGLALRLGGYVVVEHDGGRQLGQVLELEPAQASGAELDLAGDGDDGVALRAGVTVRFARGSGALLEGDETPFHDATARPATPEEVRAWARRSRRGTASLDIGELALAPGVACELDAGGFDRHTFLCGQSGSGKSYALGVILERLLMETGLRIVILDPNSDFVRLADVRDGVDAGTADRYREATRSVSVHSGRDPGERRLRIRFGELDPAAQAALLRLDPIEDREEHAELVELLDEGRVRSVAAIEASTRPGARQLALRARNLGLERLGVWAGDQTGSTLQAIHEPAARAVVVGLGTLATQEEQALTAAAVLGSLWRRREDRHPVLIVIDEAHNVCPAAPPDPLTALATSHAIRIAAEGRKFGLYLLVSTQRPQKVHENVISQCDNLVLMRLNSAADAAFAQGVFSFVPPRLVEQAAAFRLGEALVAGKISPHPALVRFGARVAEEGGSDVPATWATAAR
jgi:DNA helicase HerA-like ATPase